jgi:hypothetical protein
MKKLFILLVILGCLATQAQQLDRLVLASSGNHWQAGNLQMSFTLGESFTKAHSAATLFVLSGFQQGDAASGIGLTPPVNIQASVYPNPSRGVFAIDLESNVNANLRIYTLQGALIWQADEIDQWPQEVDISDQPTGTYILEINGVDQNLQGRVKLLKQ